MFLTKLVQKGFKIIFEISLWLNLIVFSVGGGILANMTYNSRYREGISPVLGGFLGLLVGIFISCLVGGFIANLLKLSDNTEHGNLNIFNNLQGITRNPFLLSIIISGIIILVSLIISLLIPRGGFWMFIRIPMLVGLIAFVINIIGYFRIRKIFALIAGIMYCISIILGILMFMSYSPTFIAFSLIGLLFIVPSILCFIEFKNN